MRCPKCGFISFDHLTSCAKCGRDISEVASELQGTSIKIESPMFLSGALTAVAERGGSFEGRAMEADLDAEIDFAMEVEGPEEESGEMGDSTADIDFSFEGTGEKTAGMEQVEETVDIALDVEAEEEASSKKSEKNFEEIDFMGPVDEEDESTLEFDLEDFIEELDDDKAKK
jgi:hypothetical protein